MRALETRGHAGAGVAAGVHDVLAVVVLRVVEQRLEARLDEAPWAGVERLFLRPHNRLRVGVAVQVLAQLAPWEGVQLLNTGQGCVAELLMLRSVLLQRRIHLSSAHDYALNVLVVRNAVVLVRRVRDDPAEV